MQEAEYGADVPAELNALILLGRHGTRQKLLRLFTCLAGEEAADFTAAVVTMDGGETAGRIISGGEPGHSEDDAHRPHGRPHSSGVVTPFVVS